MLEFKQNLPFADADGCYELLDGNRIPAIGFGTWRVKDREDGAPSARKRSARATATSTRRISTVRKKAWATRSARAASTAPNSS